MNNNIAINYYKILIFLFVIAPFVGYVTNNYLHMDFNRVMQLLSYIGVFFVMIFRYDNNPIRFPKYILFLLLFIIYTFFSTFILMDREFKMMYLFSNGLIGALNFMIIIENFPVHKKFFENTVLINKAMVVIAFIVIMLQQIIDPGLFVLPDEVKFGNMDASNLNESRLPSIYSWAGDFSKGFGFIPIFIIVVEYLYKRKKRIFLWIFIGLIYAFLTKSRWIMVNALLVFTILIVHNENKTRQFLKLLLLVPIMFIAAYFVMDKVGIETEEIFTNRVKSKTADSRLVAFEVFNKLYWESPVLGAGDSKYGMGGEGKQDYKLRIALAGRSSQIHVGYLALLHRYGLIGGFFFMGFLYLLFKKIYINAKKTNLWGPFLGILGFALANLTLVYFSFFEMGLLYALMVDKYYIDTFNLSENKTNKTMKTSQIEN
jgi:hypothetical protein